MLAQLLTSLFLTFDESVKHTQRDDELTENENEHLYFTLQTSAHNINTWGLFTLMPKKTLLNFGIIKILV
jgi:hypothetical protein